VNPNLLQIKIWGSFTRAYEYGTGTEFPEKQLQGDLTTLSKKETGWRSTYSMFIDMIQNDAKAEDMDPLDFVRKLDERRTYMTTKIGQPPSIQNTILETFCKITPVHTTRTGDWMPPLPVQN
jgi:hypothetical protein